MEQKIKIQFALAIIIILLATQVYSQRIYINAGAGYGMSAAPNVFLGFDNSATHIQTYDGTSTSDVYTSNLKNIKGTGSFGKGIQAGATFGYMFTEHIGAELGIGYLMGSHIISKDATTESYIDLTDNRNNTTASMLDEETISGKMLRFIPALRITTGTGKLKPYMRIGVVIGVSCKLNDASKSTINDVGLANTMESESVMSGGTSLGFACGVGADFKLNNTFGIFAEMGINTQSWAPSKNVITKATINGIDVLSQLTTSEKEISFVDSYSTTSNDPFMSQNPNPGMPSQQLKIYLPFSSVGVNLGVRIALGKKK